MFKLFNDYRAFYVDNRKRKELPEIQKLLKEMRDDEIENYINEHEIHRQCRWKTFYDIHG